MENGESPKRSKKEQSAAKKLRNAKAHALALEGKNVNEIAQELKVDRNTVARILSNDEAKRIVREAESAIHGLVINSVDVIRAALNGKADDMTNGLKAAVTVLKSVGAIKDRLDVSHTFPKPTVITKRDGTEVILGHVNKEDEE